MDRVEPNSIPGNLLKETAWNGIGEFHVEFRMELPRNLRGKTAIFPPGQPFKISLRARRAREETAVCHRAERCQSDD
jgi:hypothetical protein